MQSKLEVVRQLNELALSYGKQLKSAQTNYLHYNENANGGETHLSIPIVENLMYALALLRSRTIENVGEAKLMLEGILHFQNSGQGGIGEGNFPIFLHEYPVCKDRFLGLHAGCILFWIWKQFNQVLGQDLKVKIESALKSIVRHVISTYTEKPGPYVVGVKVGALLLGVGRLFDNADWENRGNSILEEHLKAPDLIAWSSSSTIAEILSGLIMVYPKIAESPWKGFWEHVQQTWHPLTSCYTGPAFMEWQRGLEPEVTLYDMFGAVYSGKISKRALKPTHAHLESVLALNAEDHFEEISKPFSKGQEGPHFSWKLEQHPLWAYSVITSEGSIVPQNFEKGLHSLRLVWGEEVHSLVIQGGAPLVKFSSKGSKLILDFSLAEPVDTVDREENREICLFMDIVEGCEFYVEEHKASTFTLGERVTVRSGSLAFKISFLLIEGEGKFLGHRMLGNRPSQLSNKGNQRYNAYDWQIFLRTVLRNEQCLVRAVIEVYDA